jgi:hypothetical protein
VIGVAARLIAVGGARYPNVVGSSRLVAARSAGGMCARSDQGNWIGALPEELEQAGESLK